MKRWIWISVAALALAGAGVAVADEIESKAVKSVTGAFTATSVGNLRTSTCTNSDGTFSLTRGRYTGTATSSDPSLNGPITLDVRSLINTTKSPSIGTVEGRLRIDTAGGRDTTASIATVFSGGSIAGLAAGRAQDPFSRLLANVSASFSPTGGFTSGKLGDTAGGAAVELTPGHCRPAAVQRPERIEARGTVTALSAASITAAGVTCAIPADLQAAVASRVKVGDRVEMRCTIVNSQATLTRLEVKRK